MIDADNAARESDVRFQCGYKAKPWYGLSQVLWFSYPDRASSNKSLTAYFWIEHDSGRLQAVRLSGLTEDPEMLIPAFTLGTKDSRLTLEQQLRSGHLLPLPIYAIEFSNAPTAPTSEFLGAIYQEFPSGEDSPVEKIMDISKIFTSRLSPEAIFIQNKYFFYFRQADSIEGYNAIATMTESTKRNRIQAVKKFPWIFDFILFHRNKISFNHTPGRSRCPLPSRFSPFSQEIFVAIDAGAPLLQVISRHYGIHLHTARNSRRLISANYSCLEPESVSCLLNILDGMKADFQPRDGILPLQIRCALAWISRWNLDKDPRFTKQMAADFFKDGVDGSERFLRRQCPSINVENPYDDLEDFIFYSFYPDNNNNSCEILDPEDYDFIDLGRVETGTEHFHEYWEIKKEKIGKLIKNQITACGIRALFIQAQAWHQEALESRQLWKELSWKPLLPLSKSAGNLIVHELSSTAMLIEEGEAMQHCVASRAELCAKGNDFIFSLCNQSDKRASTLHIARLKNGRFVAVEHKGPSNQTPDTEASIAEQNLLFYLNSFTSEP